MNLTEFLGTLSLEQLAERQESVFRAARLGVGDPLWHELEILEIGAELRRRIEQRRPIS